MSKNIWSDQGVLGKLEKERDEKQGRLTFNCLELRCGGDRAWCSKGHKLGQARDGSLTLISVLRGTTSGTCKGCSEYSTEEEQ